MIKLALQKKRYLKIALNHQDSEPDQACIAEKHDT